MEKNENYQNNSPLFRTEQKFININDEQTPDSLAYSATEK